jgi:hypothetical protein
MFKRRLGALFLVTCLSLTTIPCVLGAQSTITVNPTSGTDAQIAINSAIDSAASGATSSNPGSNSRFEQKHMWETVKFFYIS